VSYVGADGRPINLHQDKTVEADLRRVFQPSSGQKWVGLVSPEGSQRRFRFDPPNFVSFDMMVRITPARGKTQVVPYVGRYKNAGFRRGYLPGLWDLRSRP